MRASNVFARTMEIDRALRWAFVNELPKARRDARAGELISSWRAVAAWAETMCETARDGVNRYGLVALDGECGEPHADALLIGEAVLALDQIGFDLPEDWRPDRDVDWPSDLRAQAVDEARRRACRRADVGRGRDEMRLAASTLVQRCAVMGDPPDWEIGETLCDFVRGASGRPRWFRRVELSAPGAFGDVVELVEVDGYDARAKRPHPDAYFKRRLEPSPVDALVRRAEYEVWRTAMDVLHEELAGRVSFDLRPCAWPARPWERGLAGA